jgi:hypothetical protein
MVTKVLNLKLRLGAKREKKRASVVDVHSAVFGTKASTRV